MVAFNGGGDSSSALWTGWEDHSDGQYTDVSPFQPSTGVWTDLPNNSASVISSQRPVGVASLFDANKITGRNGDGLMVTVEFIAKPTTATITYADIAVFIGGGLGPLGDGRIYERTLAFPKGQGVIKTVTYTTGMFTLGTFEANGGQLQINPTAALDVYNIRTVVHRTHKAR